MRPSTLPRTPRALLVAAGAIACLQVSACKPGGDAEAAGPHGASKEGTPAFEGLERNAATKVRTTPVRTKEMVRSIATSVTAESERQISIFPRTGGVVVEVAVEEGDRVEKDEVLMQLDDRELLAALEEARVAEREAIDAKRGLEFAVSEAEALVTMAELTHEQSKRELERKERAGEGLLSKNELEQLRLTVETNLSDVAAKKVSKARADTALLSQEIAIEKAKLGVQRAQLNESFTRVVAPFAGVIATRTVREGDLVTSATEAFTLTDVDHVRAVVSRPQRELAFFRSAEARAQRASGYDGDASETLDIEVLPEALPDHSYAGRILFVSPTIDPASGQFRVTLEIEQPEENDPRPPVLPGMLLRVRIVTERHPDALVVPKRALVREGDSHFIVLEREKKAVRVAVEEGFTTDDEVEVLPTETDSVKAGDTVVVIGNRDLETGDSLDPSPWYVPGEAPPEEEDGAMEPEEGAGDEPATADGESTTAADEDSAETEEQPADEPGADSDAD